MKTDANGDLRLTEAMLTKRDYSKNSIARIGTLITKTRTRCVSPSLRKELDSDIGHSVNFKKKALEFCIFNGIFEVFVV